MSNSSDSGHPQYFFKRLIKQYNVSDALSDYKMFHDESNIAKLGEFMLADLEILLKRRPTAKKSIEVIRKQIKVSINLTIER